MPPSDAKALLTSDVDRMKIYVLHEHASCPVACQVPVGTTPGQVTQAEARCRSMHQPIAPRSLMNTHLPLYEPLHDGQYVVIHQQAPLTDKCPFLRCEQKPPTLEFPRTRIHALWKQRSWVALDEMEYYLQATQLNDEAFAFPPISFHNEADVQEVAHEWLHWPSKPSRMTSRGAPLPLWIHIGSH